MTIFSCFLPIDVVTPIFDMFIYEGWRSVFKVGIALLRYLEQQLLEMDMTDMSSYFREKVRTEGVANKFQLFMRASRVRVNTILVGFLPSLTSFGFLDPQQRAREVTRKVLHHSSANQTWNSARQLALRPERCTNQSQDRASALRTPHKRRHRKIPRKAAQDWQGLGKTQQSNGQRQPRLHRYPRRVSDRPW